MVFLPPDQATQTSSSPQNQTGNNLSIYSSEGKYQSNTTTNQDQAQYSPPAGDGGMCGSGGDSRFPDPEFSYRCTPQSMILVQVNPGETFTIQAEDETQCIEGPAQVPMVSPNGAIPPIHVPHGYISQVIEENGLRRVVVIPEMQPTHFPTSLGAQQLASQPPHGMHQYSMQAAPPISYMQQQMNVMSLNPQATMFQAGDHLPMFHPHQVAYGPPDGSNTSDINNRVPSLPQHHQYQFQLHSSDMDPTNPASRAAIVRERLQKKLHDRHHHPRHLPPDSNKNPSPTSTSSISLSSLSSYGQTPSPNSSPDTSPRILGTSIPVSTYPNGFNNQRKYTYPMQPHLLSSSQPYQQHYPSPTHSPNFPSGNNGYRNTKNNQVSPKASTSDEMSSESSSGGGSPRRVPLGPRNPATTQEMVQQYQVNMQHQQDIMFHSNVPQEPYPTKDGKWDLKEYLSAILKPEVHDVQPRSARLKWSLRYSLPEEAGIHLRNQTIIYEVFLTDKGRDSNKYKIIQKDRASYFEIKDLKPGVEYHTKVLAELNSTKGVHSEITTFRTISCQPDTPGAPELYQRTKNSLGLKWAAPNSNGEKIIKYNVEWDEGKKGSGFRSLYTDSQRQYKVSKLQPSHDYTFRLNSQNKIGASSWSPEVTYRTTGTAPKVPDPPHLSKAFVRSLVLTWTRVPSGGNDSSGYATKFILEMDDGKGYGFKVVHDGPDLRAQVKSLNKSSLYKFRLRAYNNEGKSGYSSIASYYTLPDKPNPPGKVTLKGKAHPTWFKVSWDAPEEDGGAEVTKYVLECSHERGQQMEQIYSGLEREFHLGNVQPGVTCRLRVFCITNGGTSMPSEVAVITPPPVHPGQCAPPRLSTKSKPNMIYLRWDPPNYNGGSNVTQYEVAMIGDNQEAITESPATSSENSVVTQVYLGPALDHVVGGLKPGTTYRFMVRAANKVGDGPWSDTVDLETSAGPPEKPQLPIPDTVTSDSILLTWKKPHDNGSEVTGYSVEWGSSDTSMNIQQLSSCLSYNFQRLTPDTDYYFRVQAHNVTGKSAFSDVATVHTTPSCPDRITKVWQGDLLPLSDYVVDLGDDEKNEDDEIDEDSFPRPSTSVMLNWDIPISNGSDITNYIMEVTPVKPQTQSKKTKSLSFLEADTMLFEIEGDVSCHLLQNLQPDSEYRIRVKAVNEMGSGLFSSPVTVETQPLPPDPPVLECSCSYNSLKLKWGDSTDSTNNIYLLQMKEKHGRFMTIYNGSGRSYRVNRLSERTNYIFRINARNHAGEGPFSIIYNFTTTTAPPPQLKYLPSVIVSDNHAEISWEDIDNIKGDSVSYIINIEDYEDPNSKQSILLDKSSYTLGPLKPGSKHKIQVALVRHVVHSQQSNVIKQDVATQLEDTDSMTTESATKEVVNQEETIDESPKYEEIIGNFSSWVSFEVVEHIPVDEISASKLNGKPDSSGQLQTATSLLPVQMSDERKALALLITFFIFAVVLAFFVQLMVG